MKLFYNISVLCFLIVPKILCAQVNAFISEKTLSANENYLVQTWTTENGLPQNSINDIVQDQEGYIWLATFDGLVRFDGVKFKIFNSTNTPELKANAIKDLFVDSDNKLWIISIDGKLLSYHKGKFKTHNVPANLLFHTNAIAGWKQHSVLVVCDNNKIYQVNNQKVVEFIVPEYIDTVRSIQSKFNDQLFVGTNAGLYSYINNEWYDYPTLGPVLIHNLYKSANNDVVASIKWKLLKVYANHCEEVSTPTSLSELKSYTVGFNEKNEICLLSNKGLYTIINNKNCLLSTQNGLSSNNINTTFVDKQNNFWVGTANGGLNKLKTKLFKTLSKEDGMNEDGVTAIIESEKSGVIIANTCGGLSQFLNNKFTGGLKVVDKICEWSLLEDNNKIWAGNYGGGIQVLDNGRISKTYNVTNGLPSNVVFALYKDSKNIIWAGTNAGLCYYSNGSFIKCDPTFKNDVTYIFEDRNKQMFLATSKGLAILNKQKIILVNADALKNVTVRHVYEDSEGVLWIGTHGKGLIRFKNSVAFSFSEKASSLDNNVWSITEDAQNNFWLPSNAGMYVVNKKDLNDFADGNIKSVNPIYLSKEDGLKSNEFNGGFQPAMLKSKSGEFWFPTVKGVAVVNPNALKKQDYIPQIIIEKIESNKKEFEIGDTLQLSFTKDEVNISFTAPSFINANRLSFQYKLDGLDNNWIDLGTSREIQLSELPYGYSTLRIRIIGSNKETSLSILKATPFWKETSFIISAIIFGAILLIAISLFIITLVKKKEKRKTELNKQYANIELKALQAQMNPHFIFNCLNSIHHFIVINDELSSGKYLTKFSNLMRMFLEHSKSNTVTLHQEIELLKLYIELEALRFKNGFDFKININDNTDVYNIEIPSMMFQPFVENAINHGLLNLNRKGTLTLSFGIENGYLIGVVEDDGVGRKKAAELKSNEHNHTSRGTEIINDRIAVLNFIENIKIELNIIDKEENNEACGTKVIVKIPI